VCPKELLSYVDMVTFDADVVVNLGFSLFVSEDVKTGFCINSELE
jgi:hypothetical protein